MATAEQTGPFKTRVEIDYVEQRSRLTVAFRILLLIPQAIAVGVLGIAAYVVVLIGWFAALFLGRLPEPFARFLTHFIGYSTRVGAYSWLLTDEYPPFRFDAPTYPVRVEVRPGSLNRLAVFFRLILGLPAQLLGSIVGTGWAAALFVAWILIIVTGRMPRALFEAGTAAFRYTTRVNTYLFLVSSAYPDGALGDEAPLAAPMVVEPVARSADIGVEPPAEPRPLVLSSRAKTIAGIVLVVGALGLAGEIAWFATNAGRVSSVNQAGNALVSAQQDLAGSITRFQNANQQCASRADALACVRAATQDIRAALVKYSTRLQSIAFPNDVATDANTLRNATLDFTAAVVQLSRARSVDEYVRFAQSGELQRTGTAFDRAFSTLLNHLAALE